MPMFGTIIRMLLDDKHTTIKEIEELTGRGVTYTYADLGDNEIDATNFTRRVSSCSSPPSRSSFARHRRSRSACFARLSHRTPLAAS